jgi:peroxiredoxin Q/BCP
MFPLHVRDHAGKPLQIPCSSGWTLLCFFTKDRTPCCGRERQALCDKLAMLEHQGVRVVGVTIDQIKEHAFFAKGCSVSYPMVQDQDFALCKTFNVLSERTYKGKPYQSVQPDAFLLDAAGRVEHRFTHFDLEHEALKVLERVQPEGA